MELPKISEEPLLEILEELKSLGEIFYEAEAWWGSSFIYKEAVDISGRIESGELRATINADMQHQLGTSLIREQRFEEAEACLKNGIEQKKKLLTENESQILKSSLADSLNNMSSIFWVTGRKFQAVELLKEILNIRKEIMFYGDSNRCDILYKILATWWNMMTCYIEGGMFDAALNCGRQAIKDSRMFREKLENSSLKELQKIVRKMIGITENSQDFKKSIKYLNILISIEKELNFDMSEEYLAHNLRKLGDIYFEIRKFHKAKECYNQSGRLYYCLGEEYVMDFMEIFQRMNIVNQIINPDKIMHKSKNIKKYGQHTRPNAIGLCIGTSHIPGPLQFSHIQYPVIFPEDEAGADGYMFYRMYKNNQKEIYHNYELDSIHFVKGPENGKDTQDQNSRNEITSRQNKPDAVQQKRLEDSTQQ